MKSTDLLPARAGESDDERRLRESINRMGAGLLSTLDSAIRLRTAPAEAQRTRHLARGNLVDFALKAMHALNLTAAEAQANTPAE